jgi:hypothetical protein
MSATPVFKTTTNDGGDQFCRGYFGMSHKCSSGDKCKFSHDEEAYLVTNKLKRCQTDGCTKFCKGVNCRTCKEKNQGSRQEAYDKRNAHRMGRCEKCAANGDSVEKVLTSKKVGEEKPRPGNDTGKAIIKKLCMTHAGEYPCEWCEKVNTPWRLCRDCKDTESQYTLGSRY